MNEEYPTELKPDPKTGEMVPTTKGYCFLEFEDEETALKAQEKLNKHRFDKQHIFAANLFTGKFKIYLIRFPKVAFSIQIKIIG